MPRQSLNVKTPNHLLFLSFNTTDFHKIEQTKISSTIQDNNYWSAFTCTQENKGIKQSNSSPLGSCPLSKFI